MKSSSRTRKLGENVREALADILLNQVSDPRLALVTVTSVEVSPDMRVANVHVTTTHGDAERYAEVLAGMESAKGRMRAELGKRVKMKYVPDLRFYIDRSVDEGMHMYKVLEEERERVDEMAARRPEGAEHRESPYRDDERDKRDGGEGGGS